MAVVDDVGLLMELQSYAVATQVADNAIVILVRMLLYGMTDVTDKAVGLSSLGSNLKALLSDPYELFFLGCGLANDEHA